MKRRDASTLEVWFSVRKDVSGEKIYQTTVDVVVGSWITWGSSDAVTVLEPEEPWEGSTLLFWAVLSPSSIHRARLADGRSVKIE